MFSRPWPSIKPRPKPFEQGSCECGNIIIKVLGTNFRTDGPQGKLCHCTRCRQLSSSHYRHNLTIPPERLVIEGSGSLKTYADEVVPGQRSFVFFCARCGCDVASRDADSCRDYYIPLGLFEGTPEPVGEMMSYQKVKWLRNKLGLKQLDE